MKKSFVLQIKTRLGKKKKKKDLRREIQEVTKKKKKTHKSLHKDALNGQVLDVMFP